MSCATTRQANTLRPRKVSDHFWSFLIGLLVGTSTGVFSGVLPRDLQIPLTNLAIYALGRHRRLARERLEDASRAENDILDRALCQRGDDIDMELVRRTPATQEEREIVLAALGRIKGCSMLATAAVAQMEDDLRAA